MYARFEMLDAVVFLGRVGFEDRLFVEGSKTELSGLDRLLDHNGELLIGPGV